MMPPILSPRLKTIADWIAPATSMADIGTDHAYLPVYLCMTGKLERGIASDIRSGPLKRATATIQRYHLEDRIETRLGGGAETLSPHEAEVIVIAGMGGLVIGEILKARPSVFSTAKQIILQPMTSIPELRGMLSGLGYTITRETLAKEETKLYTIIEISPSATPEILTPLECYLGKGLLETKPPHFNDYCRTMGQKLLRMENGLKKSTAPESVEKRTLITALLTEMKQRSLF